MKKISVYALLLGAGLWPCAASAPAAEKIEFNRDIRPILAENCMSCHGPDSAARKADLRLDKREAAVTSKALVPGKPDESALVERIFAEDDDEIMPPPASHKKLTAAQKDLLKRWIAAGAEYQPHWSFIAPVRPALPAVKNAAWVRNPIDRFILAKLEQAGLQPAAEADRRTLARRLSLDLTGLPPMPALVDEFVADKSPDAYEKLVDKLLATSDWGEHRARYWLDAARYGDTHGIHIDNFREIWSYREWVINAFNRNMPFDQFTIEQLAGDLLPNRTLEQQIGSGFNRCNITTSEGGAIAEEYLVLYARDRTETTSQVWLGLTTGCAVCHDHKFDPLTQREFYELAAFFNNTTQAGMDGNIKDTPPVIIVPAPADRARWDVLAKDSTDVKAQLETRRRAARPEFEKWLPTANAGAISSLTPHDGLKMHALLSDGSAKKVTVTVDGQAREISFKKDLAWQPGRVSESAFKTQPEQAIEIAEAGDFDTKDKFSCSAWIKLAKDKQSGAIVARMDEREAFRGWELWVEGGKLAGHLIHKHPDELVKVAARNPLKVGQWVHVALAYNGSGKAGGLQLFIDGEVVKEITAPKNNLEHTIRTATPLKIGQRSGGSKLADLEVQDVRIYGRTLTQDEIERIGTGSRAAWLVRKAETRTAAEKNELYAWWLPALDKAFQEVTIKLAGIEQEQATIKSRGTIAHVMQEKSEQAMAHVLFRGAYDQRRDEVKPNTPAILPPLASDLPRNRIGFAEWLLRPEHPLTARVTVNRFWQEVFGTGLVRTAGDFGATGESPSHPELLDWMAVEFRESGWDVKRFYKLLVTSAAYRQAATATREKLDKDPFNRLLSRGPRFRMDGEMLRDYALAASGLLVRKIGGPSVKPYQPEGVWEAVAMLGSNTRDYKQDSGENLYRRSMYTFWKRSAPPASMDIFNAPSREVCTVRRERTNTPLQALVTMNDPQFVEAARHLAETAIHESGEKADAGIDLLARRLLARPLRADEQPVVKASLDGLLAYYKDHADDAGKLLSFGESKSDAKLKPETLAAWTMLANELMNLDEVLNK